MRLKDENADLKRRLEELEEKHKYANRQVRDGLPKVHGAQQVEVGSQGPTAQGAVRQCRES